MGRPVITPRPFNGSFLPSPNLNFNQAAVNTALLGQALQGVPPLALGFNPYSASLSTFGGAGLGAGTLSTNPYGVGNPLSTNPYASGYGSGYGYGYGTEDPVAGFLRGTSDVIREQGNYLKNVQTARIIQTSADEGRLDYRRRLIEEARYERMSQPTAEEIRQQQLGNELNRARHEPPISDIISARSLNDLLHHLSNDPTRPKGQTIPVDDEVLKHINVTGVNPNGASVGLLKDEGKLQWPQSLSGAEFQGPRELLSKTLRNVVQNLKSGESVGAGSLNDLKTDLAQLNNLVSKSELSADRLHRSQKLSRPSGGGGARPWRQGRGQLLQPQVQCEERGGTHRRHEDEGTGFRPGGAGRRRRLSGAATGSGGL